MKLNSKVTWGLAWAGLAVVVAVPSVDFLTGRAGASTAAVVTSTTDPVQTASTTPLKTVTSKPAAPVKTASVTTKVTKNGVSIVPNKTATPATNDPVDKLLRGGKPLPDYISDGSGEAATSAPEKTTGTAPTQVASIDPAAPVSAPMPFPSWARPHTVDRPVVAKPPVAKAQEPTVIVDEDQLDTQQATIDTQDAGPIPPAGIVDDNAQTWKRSRLDRYLEQNGLVDDSGNTGESSASVTVIKRPSKAYDADGFYLSDGPNNAAAKRAARRARLEQMFEDEEDNSDDGFTFNLF